MNKVLYQRLHLEDKQTVIRNRLPAIVQSGPAVHVLLLHQLQTYQGKDIALQAVEGARAPQVGHKRAQLAACWLLGLAA